MTGTELQLKTEQLLYVRLMFALSGLGVSILVSFFLHPELNFSYVITILLVVALYSLFGLPLIRRSSFEGRGQLNWVNGILLTLDIVSITALVHFTGGIDSNLYYLYLLPILLSSHTFGRRGIYAIASAVSITYVGLMLSENRSFLPYLTSAGEGFAAAYARRLFVRIGSLSAVLISVSFIWGAFCDYMSRVTEYGANRLRGQLDANERMVAETRAQAAREHLINTISSAVRGTLDLDEILTTTITQLGSALNATRSAIICPPDPLFGPPAIWETINAVRSDHQYERLSEGFCRFILAHKSKYEENVEDGTIKKTFVFDEPIHERLFQGVRQEVISLEFKSLVLQPIIYGSESKGVLLIGECEEMRRWTSSELQLVKAVAGQVAIAIEHARLVDQLSRKNRDLLQKNRELDARNLELRSTQSQLIHQEKMASLGRMVAGIAHELNNPVNFVHGNLPYLREYFDHFKQIIAAYDSLPADERIEAEALKKKLKYDFLVADLDNIIADLGEGAERVRQIIKNLRSFSRLDEAELKEASIQDGIESSLKILNQYYGRDMITVERNFADLPQILCYPGQLNQVWVNLLSNAAEAVSAVSSPKVEIGCALEDDWVTVWISDNGTGIKAEDQGTIFEPFFTTKPIGQGTGLGLSICHSIIERHGGRIWFETKPGEGTTFKVRIPLKAEERMPLIIDESMINDQIHEKS